MSKVIEEDVKEILARSTTSGTKLFLPATLPRTDYTRVNEAIERMGGKWNRAQKAHVFATDAREIIEGLCGMEKLPDKYPLSYFPTPPAVIEKMFEFAFRGVDGEEEWLEKQRSASGGGIYILEPSAGTGELAQSLFDAFQSYNAIITCIELDSDRARSLRCRRFSPHMAPIIYEGDFTGDELFRFYPNHFSLVFMNPPFSIGGKQVYCEHIRKAESLLAPDGILVSVAPEGFIYNDRQPEKDFRGWIYSIGGEWETLPEKAFQEACTGVRTGLIKIVKK